MSTEASRRRGRWFAGAAVALACACGPDSGAAGGDDRGSDPAAPPSAGAAAPSTTADVAEGALHFQDVTAASGIDARHHPARSAEKWMPEILGSGVLVRDLDGNGAPDVLLVGGGELAADERPDAARNRLYLNDGSGQFTDATSEWSLPSTGYGMGAAAGDVDGDGWTDVVLTTFEGDDRLLRNTGSALLDVSRTAGLATGGGWSTSAGFLDLENDGDLDLYVVKYVDYSLQTALRCHDDHVHVYCTPLLYDGLPDRLWVNGGDGTFTEVSEAAGLSERRGKGLGLAIGDIDLDGDSDVYVANDSTANHLLVNDGAGGLVDEAPLRGGAYGVFGREEAGMGVDLGDVDGDGTVDIVCTNFQGEATSVYCQDARGFFQERSDALGLGPASRRTLGFGVALFDGDDDGDLDLVTANGHIDDVVETRLTGIGFAQRDGLARNDGGKLHDVSDVAGDFFDTAAVSRGLVTADLDGDGRLDIVVMDNGGRLRIGRNVTRGGASITLRLEPAGGRSPIGTRVVARVGERNVQRQVPGASSYLSAGDDAVHLGLGDTTSVDELLVQWPDGETQSITDLPTGRAYRLAQGGVPEPYVPGERR